MSDPVTNVEIEDVLSSIRKLVSQDTAKAEVPSEAQPDALILTEDHRVDETPETSETSETPVIAKPDMADMRRKAASTVRTELERAIEELEATMGIAGEQDKLQEEVAEEEQVQEDPSEESVEAQQEAFDPHPENDAPEGENAEETHAVGPHVEEDVEEHLEASGEASWEDPVEEDSAFEEPDEPTASEYGQPSESQDAVLHDDIDWDAPVGHAVEGEPPEADEQVEERSVLEAIKIVSDASGTAGQDYDEAYEGDVLKGAELEFEEEASGEIEFTATGAPFSEETVDPWPQPEDAGGTAQDFAVDEDMLRDLVAEIVRAELQGELGERITRNVRKLVRREINRALAGQDLI